MIGMFVLESVDEALLEKAELVVDAVAESGKIEGGE